MLAYLQDMKTHLAHIVTRHGVVFRLNFLGSGQLVTESDQLFKYHNLFTRCTAQLQEQVLEGLSLQHKKNRAACYAVLLIEHERDGPAVEF